jgi:HNH endonuclease/RuvA, C-terminal domain
MPRAVGNRRASPRPLAKPARPEQRVWLGRSFLRSTRGHRDCLASEAGSESEALETSFWSTTQSLRVEPSSRAARWKSTATIPHASGRFVWTAWGAQRGHFRAPRRSRCHRGTHRPLAKRLSCATLTLAIAVDKGALGGAERLEISRVSLARMGTVEAASLGAEGCEWMRAHEALSRLARQRAAADAEEGRWFLCALRSAAHVHLGHASFSQYIERIFGYSPRSTQEKLRVAEALEQLPRLARSLETGALSWCAARELTRVAVAATEQAWLDAAQGKTTREIEALVAGKNPGDEPQGKNSEQPRSRVLRFEVAPETFALFREALHRLRRAAGGSLDDDAALLSMARQVLGGPADDGRSSYQVSLTVCAACGSAWQQAGGELVPVSAEIVAMAECDAQHLGQLLPRAANENSSAPLSAARSKAQDPSDVHHHVGVGFATANSDARVGADVSRDARVGADVASASRAHSGATEDPAGSVDSVRVDAIPLTRDVGHSGQPRPRAKQTIPPAVRRAVLTRDQRRCRVPGCTHMTFVDVHHIVPRSEGGRNEATNLVTLCGAHHRAVHRGELSIEPSGEAGLRFRHADGTPYGQPVAPYAVDVQAKVFSALRNLGFREREVRAVLAELSSNEHCETTAAGLLREALRRIRPAPR